MRSSFEKPNTKASLLSTMVTSTSSGTSSDNMVASSRPAKPAPSMSTVFIRISVPPAIANRSPDPFLWCRRSLACATSERAEELPVSPRAPLRCAVPALRGCPRPSTRPRSSKKAIGPLP